MNEEQVSVTKKITLTELDGAGAKRDVKNTLKLYYGPMIQSRPCQS